MLSLREGSRMKKVFLKVWDVQVGSSILPSLIFICVFFIIGAIAGSMTAAGTGNETELSSAAADYMQRASVSFGSVYLKLIEYPIALVMCGICVFGAVLIPIVIAVRGFFLSFAMTTFIRIYGGAGLLYSASLFGIQTLFVLPCVFLLAAQGLVSSSHLFSLASGRGKKISGPVFGGAYFLRVLICFAVILLCSAAETYLTPYLISLVAKNILT